VFTIILVAGLLIGVFVCGVSRSRGQSADGSRSRRYLAGPTMTQTIARKVLRSLQSNGPWGTLQLIGLNLKLHARSALIQDGPNEFDSVHGTDTGSAVAAGDLGIDVSRLRGVVGYQGICESQFSTLLCGASIDYPRFTFIDLGSGKGKALLLAGAHPFKNIVGVELSPMLHEAAARNLAIYRGDLTCRNISPILADAADFQFPAGPLIILLYNPFDSSVMRAVMANLSRSFAASPREIVVMYLNARHADVLTSTPWLNTVVSAAFTDARNKSFPWIVCRSIGH